MKVLHVVINGEIAGGQRVCLQIIEALLDKGHQALVVSPTKGPLVDLLKEKGIPVFFLPFEKTYSFHRAFQLSKLIRRERVDIVHTHGMVPLNVQARIAAKLAGIPCISHIHIANVFNSNPLIRGYQIFLDNLTSSFCRTLIAVSRSTKESLVKQGIPENRVTVVPNGVDPGKARPRRSREEIFQEFRIEPNKRLVGMIGRLCPTKGQEEFLKAVTMIKDEAPDVIWVIAGKDIEFGGKYEKKLKNLARDLGLNGSVIFAGHQEDPDSLLNAMDLFVLPSKREGLPLVVLEAMALKKPVIATRVDGVPELIEDGRTGVLVPPAEPAPLAEAMLKLLNAPDKAMNLGEAGYMRARRDFCASEMIQRILSLYQEAISRSTAEET